ncbi:hypothetical protein FOL47_005516, partial [Perkinsus chesapeaki]
MSSTFKSSQESTESRATTGHSASDAAEDLHWRAKKLADPSSTKRRRSERLKSAKEAVAPKDTDSEHEHGYHTRLNPLTPSQLRSAGVSKKKRTRSKTKKSSLTRTKGSRRASATEKLRSETRKKAQEEKVESVRQQLEQDNPLDDISWDLKKRLSVYFALRLCYVIEPWRPKHQVEAQVAELIGVTSNRLGDWIRDYELNFEIAEMAPTEDPYNPKCDDEPKAKKKRLLPVKQRFDWIEEVAEQGRSCYYCKICSNDVVLLKCLSDSGTQEYFTNLGVDKTQDPGRKAEVHQERASHKAAICRRDVISGVRPSAIEALTKAALRDFQRQKAADSYFIKEYIKLALWCASHEVPNTTMFEPLIDLISSKDHAMLKWAKVRPGNATYRSKATVTELVSLCAAVCDDRAIGRLKRGVTAFGKWSLMLDETSLFGQSIIGIYARYLSADKGIETAELVEDLVACCAISSTKSAAIEQCLISELQSRGVDDEMWSKLAALSCDGAASMSSEGQGLFGRLKARLQLPFLQFQHCRAHRTNLAAKSILATGDHPLAEEIIVLSQQLYAYMSKSNKKLELFKQVHREEPAEGNGKFVKLVEAGGTRWLSHNNSLKRLLRVYPRVVKLLYLISNDQDFDVNERVLEQKLARLTRAFQSVDWTLDRAIDLTTTVIQKLE